MNDALVLAWSLVPDGGAGTGDWGSLSVNVAILDGLSTGVMNWVNSC